MAWTKIYADTEPQRINRWLGQSGVCSRREAESLIAKGLVSIDGQIVTDPGRKILQGQTLILRDDTDSPAPFSIIIHKPAGIVSAQPEPDQIPAVRLLTEDAYWPGLDPDAHDPAGGLGVPSRDASLPALGRLDKDSRGLLILSEDGVLAKAIIGPASSLTKEYRVEVDGVITDRKIALLRHGLTLDGRRLRPAKVHISGEQMLNFTLSEGRNRQIRRMCELVDLYVVDLMRTRIGPLNLGTLPEGRWRHLTQAERAALISG
jgi:23S rRNA pseudouridine2604 synthase